MHTHIELLDRFMSGKTSPEEERTLLAWFRDPDHKEEIMAFYKSRWEESSGKKLPPKLQGQMFCEIKKRMRQEKKTLEIKKKPHTLWKWLSYAAVALILLDKKRTSTLYIRFNNTTISSNDSPEKASSFVRQRRA